jgi:hypothetical protein
MTYYINIIIDVPVHYVAGCRCSCPGTEPFLSSWYGRAWHGAGMWTGGLKKLNEIRTFV